MSVFLDEQFIFVCSDGENELQPKRSVQQNTPAEFVVLHNLCRKKTIQRNNYNFLGANLICFHNFNIKENDFFRKAVLKYIYPRVSFTQSVRLTNQKGCKDEEVTL